MEKHYKILCINPGSTSTKIALFDNQEKLDEVTLDHNGEELARYPDIMSQLPMRKAAIYDYLKSKSIEPSEINAIAARGGPEGICYHAGAYAIDEDMIAACMDPANVTHPMCLAPVIAYEWVKEFGTPAYNYDVVMVDEMTEVAHVGSLPGMDRLAACHTLNTRAVARTVAEEQGRRYEDVTYIMCHWGGGCSTSLHQKGKIIDLVSAGECSFSPSRAGRIPYNKLVKMCFSGKYTADELNTLFANHSGLLAHLGTLDCREVEARIAAGDKKAKLIYEAFAYNLAKDIGTLSVVVAGKVDSIVITGGIAHSEMLTGMVKERVSFIAPVVVKPGAMEMEALAGGILRVLNGEEKPYRFADPY